MSSHFSLSPPTWLTTRRFWIVSVCYYLLRCHLGHKGRSDPASDLCGQKWIKKRNDGIITTTTTTTTTTKMMMMMMCMMTTTTIMSVAYMNRGGPLLRRPGWDVGMEDSPGVRVFVSVPVTHTPSGKESQAFNKAYHKVNSQYVYIHVCICAYLCSGWSRGFRGFNPPPPRFFFACQYMKIPADLDPNPPPPLKNSDPEPPPPNNS